MSEKKGFDNMQIGTKVKRTEIQENRFELENESELEYESEEFEIEVQYDNPTTTSNENDKIYMHSYNDEQLEQLEDKLESELDEIDQDDLQLKSQDQFSETNEAYSKNYENDELEDAIKAEHNKYTDDGQNIENSNDSKSNNDQEIKMLQDKMMNNERVIQCSTPDSKEEDGKNDTEDDKEADKKVIEENDHKNGKEIDDSEKETKNNNDYLIEELWKSDLDDDYEDGHNNDLPLAHIPVYIDLGADVFKLFQPNCEEDEDFQDLGTLFPSSTILLSPLSALFEDLRKFITDGELDKRGELELKIKDLDNLTLNEDSTYCRDLSMNNLLMMYESLRENSENKDLHKFVQVELHRKWGIVDKIREIENAINKGGSLDSLSRIIKRRYEGNDDDDGGDESKIKRIKI